MSRKKKGGRNKSFIKAQGPDRGKGGQGKWRKIKRGKD